MIDIAGGGDGAETRDLRRDRSAKMLRNQWPVTKYGRDNVR
jgi:hypothetical protein